MAINNDLHSYQPILDHFGVKAHLILELDDSIKERIQPGMLSTLADLDTALKVFEEQGKPISTQALVNWAAILADTELNTAEILNELFSTSTRALNASAKASDSTMTYVYLGMNAFGLLLNLAQLNKLSALNAINHDTVNAVSGGAWNYIDAIGGLVLGIRQIAQGETGMGVVNILNGVQLATFTVVADVARYSSAIQLSAATINAFMGFSFAACMAVSCGLELYEARKCTKRIKILEHRVNELELQKLSARSESLDRLDQEIYSLEKTILIEYAQRANHKRAAASWMACAVAMTAVAIFSYLALSAVTFGALPAATVVAAAAGVVSGLIRKWWVGRKDHVANVKSDILKAKLLGFLEDKGSCLHDVIDTPVTLPGIKLHPVQTTLREYLVAMADKDLGKMKKIIHAIQQNDLEKIKAAIGEHRSYAATGGRWWGKSTGQKMIEQLFKKLNVTRESEVSQAPAR